MNSPIYKRLCDICVEKKITPTALCVAITGSQGNLSTWKKGNIRTDYLISIANKLDCSTDYLLGITDNIVTNTNNFSVSGVNNSVVGNNNNSPVTIHNRNNNDNNNDFSTQEKDLLRIYNAADGKTQMKIMNWIYQIEDELNNSEDV